MPVLIVTGRDGAEATIEGASGDSVMEVIRKGGFDDLLALCGGSCSCATCHVYVEPDVLARLTPATSFEEELLAFSDHRTATSRLSCQIPFSEALDGMRVTIAPDD